jgi:hypothetical protein
MGSVKIMFFFLDPYLYFEPKRLFNNISVMKNTDILSGQLIIQWQHWTSFFTLVLKNL